MSAPTALPFPPPSKKASTTTGAVTITASQLAAETGADLPRAERLLQVAAQTVLDYAPEAPVSLLNEAVIRFAGYLAQSDYGGIVSEEIGPKKVTYTERHGAMFRNSGAEALLTRHKVRRAGSIG